MTAAIRARLALLDPRIRVVRGEPAGSAWIAEAQAHAGTAFPADYLEFLRLLGALRVDADTPDGHTEFTVLGHPGAHSELDLRAAISALADEFERWHQPAVPAAPVSFTGPELGSACLAVADGRVQQFYRGTLSVEAPSFEQVVLERLESLERDLRVKDGKDALIERFFAELQALVPSEWNPHRRGRRLTFVRPTDGIEIEVRFGDGREYIHDPALCGVFARWSEPPNRDLAAMSAWNRDAWFVRGSVEPERCRFRGLLLANDLEPARFAAALAHDAALPWTVAPAAPVEPPREAMYRVLQRELGSRLVVADGQLTARLVERFSLGRALPAPDVIVRGNPGGLLEIRHTAATEGPRDQALSDVNRIAGHAEGDGDINFDLEPHVRAWVDGATATLAVVVPLSAATDAHRGALHNHLRQLRAAIAKAGFLARPDPEAAIVETVQRHLGLPLGPVGKLFFDHAMQRPHAFVSPPFCIERPARRRMSPWGTLVEFASWHGLGIARATHQRYLPVRLAFACDRGQTSDDCPIIGYEPDGTRARLLAADLPAMIGVLVLGTTGFDYDGDDAYVWRSFRSALGDTPWIWREREFMCRALGIRPASDIGAVQRAAGAPGEGELS